MSLLRNPRLLLVIVAVVLVGLAVFRLSHLEPKEPVLSITEGARVRFECAGISVAPDPGWGVESFDLGHAEAGKPLLCSPGLKRLGASVTALLLPQEGESFEAFVEKLHLQEVQKDELTAASGAKLVHATGFSARHADGGPAAPIRVDVFFVHNAQGRVGVVYEVALPEEAERFVSWFVKTVRVEAR
jgi:hypothetical protein